MLPCKEKLAKTTGRKICRALCGGITSALVVGALAAPAFAAVGDGNCMEDRFFNVTRGHLTCTANDVRIARASNIRDVQGNPLSQCVSGQPFSFIADFTVQLTAQTRYDIGLYFATDGDSNHDGALTGTCDVNKITPLAGTPVPLGSANYINLDSPPDSCGDITNDAVHDPQLVTMRVDNVLCQDTDADGYLNLPNCTSWRQPGSNEVCLTELDVFPGSPSKCNCDIGFNVPIFVETGTISVTKDASPASRPEPGGEFTFSVSVTNTAQFTSLTLDRICDDRFGTIAKVAAVDDCATGSIGTKNSTDCSVPQSLAPAGSYSCSFTATVSGEPQTVTDTVTVSGHDQNNKPVQGSDSAQVVIADVAPSALVIKSLNSLRCATVRYAVQVNNTGTSESLTLSALNDSGFGALTSVHGDVEATTCSVPQTIAAGGSYNCTFDAKFCGASHTDTVTGSLNDNEGTAINRDSNSLTVNVNAVQQP